MAKPLSPRDEAIVSLEAAFRLHGYEGSSISRLAEATGLGRSSLYHHFPNGKPDMAVEAARHAAVEFGRLVLDPLQGTRAPGTRLREAIAGLDVFYRGGRRSCLVEHFSVVDGAAAAPGAAKKLGEVAIAGFARVAAETGAPRRAARARAEQALVEVQGALIVARAIGDPKVFDRALARLPAIILGA